MELGTALVIAGVGVLSGALNVLAGGGSLITMPLLLELGFSGPLANGTVRVGILTQNAAAIFGFQRGGQGVNATTGWLLAAALPGAALGAVLGSQLRGAAFRYVLAGVMVGVLAWMVVGWVRDARHKRTDAGDEEEPRDHVGRPGWGGLLLMVLVGVYGGFIQAGVGFLIMAVVHRVIGENLVRTNAHKVWIVAPYTVVAIGVFAWQGAVDWLAGLTLAVGTTLGGALGARLTLKRGAALVRVVFAVALVALVARLILQASSDG